MPQLKRSGVTHASPNRGLFVWNGEDQCLRCVQQGDLLGVLLFVLALHGATAAGFARATQVQCPMNLAAKGPVIFPSRTNSATGTSSCWVRAVSRNGFCQAAIQSNVDKALGLLDSLHHVESFASALVPAQLAGEGDAAEEMLSWLLHVRRRKEALASVIRSFVLPKCSPPPRTRRKRCVSDHGPATNQRLTTRKPWRRNRRSNALSAMQVGPLVGILTDTPPPGSEAKAPGASAVPCLPSLTGTPCILGTALKHCLRRTHDTPPC